MDYSFLPQDSQGNLQNTTNIDNIIEPWTQTVEAVKKAYRAHLGDDVRGIYIHGSVARGTAKLNSSDLDTFCLTRTSNQVINLSWMKPTRQALEEQFPFASHIELQVGSEEDLQCMHHTRMIVKVLAVCVDGEDIRHSLPDIKPDTTLAQRLTKDFPARIEESKTLIPVAEDQERVRHLCIWIMKRIVRAGFHFIMPREGKYSLQLETQAARFSHYFPEKKVDMDLALQYCREPSTDKAVIMELINDFGTWLSQKIATELQD